jgi:hypothetical protein
VAVTDRWKLRIWISVAPNNIMLIWNVIKVSPVFLRLHMRNDGQTDEHMWPSLHDFFACRLYKRRRINRLRRFFINWADSPDITVITLLNIFIITLKWYQHDPEQLRHWSKWRKTAQQKLDSGCPFRRYFQLLAYSYRTFN